MGLVDRILWLIAMTLITIIVVGAFMKCTGQWTGF